MRQGPSGCWIRVRCCVISCLVVVRENGKNSRYSTLFRSLYLEDFLLHSDSPPTDKHKQVYIRVDTYSLMASDVFCCKVYCVEGTAHFLNFELGCVSWLLSNIFLCILTIVQYIRKTVVIFYVLEIFQMYVLMVPCLVSWINHLPLSSFLFAKIFWQVCSFVSLSVC